MAKIGTPRTDREGDRVARPRIEVHLAAVDLESQARPECVFGEVADDDLLHVNAELGERLAEEVVSHRPLGRHALEAHGDCVRLPRTDPDRQVSLAYGVAQDHHVLRRHHVDADALDDHLVQVAVVVVAVVVATGGHGRILSRYPGRGVRRGRCVGSGVGDAGDSDGFSVGDVAGAAVSDGSGAIDGPGDGIADGAASVTW